MCAHKRKPATDEALKAASQLGDRYIADRFLPDKAIDLLDQVGKVADGTVARAARQAVDAGQVTRRAESLQRDVPDGDRRAGSTDDRPQDARGDEAQRQRLRLLVREHHRRQLETRP